MIRDRKKKAIDRFFSLSPHIRWALLVLIVIVFTTGLYPGLVIKKHRYNSGDVAKSDIKAAEDFFIEDVPPPKPIADRQQTAVVPVYDLNPKILKGIGRPPGRRLRSTAVHVRKGNQKPANGITGVTRSLPISDNAPVEPADVPDLPQVPLAERMLAKKSLLEKAIGIEVSNGAFSILIRTRFSKDIPSLLTTIITQVLSNGVAANKEILLKESGKGYHPSQRGDLDGNPCIEPEAVLWTGPGQDHGPGCRRPAAQRDELCPAESHGGFFTADDSA
jgi:hypothetical protein